VSSGSTAHTVNFGYSAQSSLEQVSSDGHSATYGYLANSDFPETLTMKSGTTTRLTSTRSYDASDRLTGISHSHGGQSQNFGVSEFDDMNRRKKITREDGTRWNYGYNDKGEITSATREKTSNAQAIPGWSFGYGFDEIGNRSSATHNGRSASYTANQLNQYENRSVPRAFDVVGKASATASVTVDGQATQRLDEFFYKEIAAGDGAVHVPYSVAASDASDASGTTTRNGGKFLAASPEIFSYDDDGNLTADGRFAYTWDAESRLIAMETLATCPLPARRKLAFSYDAMGRRISKTVWHGTESGWQLRHSFEFLHELNGWNILAERSRSVGVPPTSFLRTYVWGSDLSGNMSGAGGVGGLLFCKLHTSNKTLAYGYDLNGNVTLLVDTANGNAAATYDYGPFGEPLRQSGEYATLNPYRFSTKYTDDESGLLDYGYRSSASI
jgi:YD repeat-containing protein